jgi:hypothetical protein
VAAAASRECGGADADDPARRNHNVAALRAALARAVTAPTKDVAEAFLLILNWRGRTCGGGAMVRAAGDVDDAKNKSISSGT